MIEHTFLLIKPDRSQDKQFIDYLCNELKKENLELPTHSNQFETIENVPTSLLEKHYYHLIDKPFFKDIVEYMQSGPVKFTIVQGDNAISKVRNLLGNTDPRLADKNSIRGKFGIVENDVIKNCCHASDSSYSAFTEITLWYDEVNNDK